MATIILLPDGQNNVSSDWNPAPFPNSISSALYNDNGDTSYAKCDDHNETMIVEFANPSVAEAAIDFTQTVSVRFLSSGRSTDRSLVSRVLIDFEVPSGNPAEYANYLAHSTAYTTVNGTPRLSYDGGVGTGWTYAQLQSLELKCTKIMSTEVYLSYLALEVTYTEAAAGYGNDVIGVASANISKVNGIATADISRVNGI